MKFLARLLRRWFPEPEPTREIVPAPKVSDKVEAARARRNTAFSTLSPLTRSAAPLPTIELVSPAQYLKPIQIGEGVFTYDESEDAYGIDDAAQSYGLDATTLKAAFSVNQGAVPDTLFNWYSQQGFIGYQACAIISQQWLVNKTLSIPAKDAVRNGYEITTIDGSELDVDLMARLKELDEEFKLTDNLIEFETNKRRFGFRIAIFVVESDDPDYYRKPFNIDGVKKGAYKGITQVDPSWIAPVLDMQAAANPAAMDFYEPTWWQISGQLYHKSHLVIKRFVNPPDILKPTYQYGGIPLTQMILERVYAAERTANEAPMLAETKRLNIVYTDIAEVTANPGGFQERLAQLIGFRDNYGVYVAGLEDRLEQIETSLADLDAVIMNQYQLVAAVSEIPATKLLGTSPKGFNASGEFEMDSYHELLENIQTDLTAIIRRHHLLVAKSEPDLASVSGVVIAWNPVTSPTPEQLAAINLSRAQTDLTLQQTGAIDALDIRNRIIADVRSGYAGLEVFDDDDHEEGDDETEFDLTGALEGRTTMAGAGSGAAPGPEDDEEKTIQEVSLNGAQISSLIEIVEKVGTGELSKQSAREIILVSFPIGDGEADKILADIVEGGNAPAPEPKGDEDGLDLEAKAKGEDEDDLSDSSLEMAKRLTTKEPRPPTEDKANIFGYVSIRPCAARATEIADWVREAGITNGQTGADIHLTIAHSSEPMGGYKPSKATYIIEPTGAIAMLANALVLFVRSSGVLMRYKELEALGAKSLYDDFRPHVTLKYDPIPGDLEKAGEAFMRNPIKLIEMGGETINVT